MKSFKNNHMIIIRKVYPNVSRIHRWSITAALIFILMVSWGCGNKNNDPGFTVDFSFSFKDDNHVMFENRSDGEYYSMIWDFGNGQKDTTTDKKQAYTVYYGIAGDYEVSLRVQDYSGNSSTTKKTITIMVNDLLVDFTADIDPENPNHVILKNTTQGETDSIKWVYRNKVVKNETDWVAYFPYSGSYDIVLQVFENNQLFTHLETIAIAQDDPDYAQNLGLVWSDEFDGTSVNPDFWTFETGATGWGNNELQNYTNGDNAEVVNGKLIITALKVDDNMLPGSYTSTRINTKTKKEFQYGRIEIRAKLPSGRGTWPALWTLGINFYTAGWPACGEMDIMEHVGFDPVTVFSTVHTPSGYGQNGSGSSMTVADCEQAFHNYGVIWNEKKLIFYLDTPDNVIHTYAPSVKTPENWPFDRPNFIIMNLAVGGNWGGAQGIDNTIFPQSLEIDYVRVYQEVP